jgi:hypothetical protein
MPNDNKPSDEQTRQAIERLKLQLDLSDDDAMAIVFCLLNRIDERPIAWAFKALLPTKQDRQCDHCGKW